MEHRNRAELINSGIMINESVQLLDKEVDLQMRTITCTKYTKLGV